jgi:hypothetical protein
MKQEKGEFGLEVVKGVAFGILLLFIIVYVIVILASNLDTDTTDIQVTTEKIGLNQSQARYLSNAPIISLDSLYIRANTKLNDTGSDDYDVDLTTGAITTNNDAWDCVKDSALDANITELTDVIQITNASKGIGAFPYGATLGLKDVICYDQNVVNGATPVPTDQYVMTAINSTCMIRTTNQSRVGQNWTIDYLLEQDCLARATYTSDYQRKQIGTMVDNTIDAVTGISVNYSTWITISVLVVIVALFAAIMFYLNKDKSDMGA